MKRKMFTIIYLIFSILVVETIIFIGGFLLTAAGINGIYALAAAYVAATFLTLFYFEEDVLEDLRGCCYLGALVVGLVIILVLIGAGLSIAPGVGVTVGLLIFAFLVEETRNL